MTYEQLYNDWNGYNVIQAEYSQLRQAAEAEWKDRQLTEQKRRQPKKKKNYEKLDQEYLDKLRDELLAKYSRVEELSKTLLTWKDDRDAKLDELAKTVVFIPQTDMVKVDESSTSTYRSQGFGAKMYARGTLQPMEAKLKQLGFSAEIRYNQTWTNDSAQWSCDRDGGYYELWANCPEWMYDAAQRITTLAEALAVHKANCINPLVYNPFLNV